MNIYLIIILFAIIGEYILSTLVRNLNLKALDPNLPQEFSDVYDEEKYRKSQEYTRTNSRFSYLTSSFSILLTLGVILLGVFNFADESVRSFGYGNIITGLLFFGILTLASDLLTTPFSLYRNFVIEEKFGFNKMTLRTFVTDKLKGYSLMLILGVPIMSLILYFFETFGNTAWLYAWGLIAGFSLAMQPLFNLVIAPMFNKFTPLEKGPLLDKIKAYVEKVEFPVSRVDVMDGSKRSSHSNAYFSGLGKNKRIALFDTLIEKQNDDEILAVIAHEVGHYKRKHIHKGIIFGILQSGIMLFLLSLFINNRQLFDAFKMQELSVYASLLFFTMLYSPIDMIVSILFNINSRKHEFEADQFSAETTGKPQHLISGLKKLSAENLGNLTPHWLNVFLNYSHPPVIDRITKLRSFTS